MLVNWKTGLYDVWMIATTCDALVSLLVACYMHRMRLRFGWYLSVAFLGVAIEAVIARIAMAFLPEPLLISGWLMGARLLGRMVKGAAMSFLALYLLGYINGRWGRKL